MTQFKKKKWKIRNDRKKKKPWLEAGNGCYLVGFYSRCDGNKWQEGSLVCEVSNNSCFFFQSY